MITERQASLIKNSFPALLEKPEQLTEIFYGKLLAKEPSFTALFKEDIKEQGKKLMAMIKTIVDNLEDRPGMAADLKALGHKHANLGVKMEDYDPFMMTFMEALKEHLGSELNAETMQAWATAFVWISSCMKTGHHPMPK
jgi:hemoglobin-like flavoprotein